MSIIIQVDILKYNNGNKGKMFMKYIVILHFCFYFYFIFVLDSPIAGMPGSTVGPVPVMRLYGVTEEGNSVCCHVHGFCSYFFVTAPPKFTDQHCRPFMV